MAKKKEELTKVETGSLQVSGLLLEQLDGLQTDGFENVTAEDMAIPIIRILQSNSPQCDRKSEEFDPDLTEGFFYNSVTKKDTETLTVIPVGFSKSYIEWAPRNSGGGFVAKYSGGHPRISEATVIDQKLTLPGGNTLVETAEHMVLVVPEDGTPYIALLPLSVTQMKHSKRFINEMATKVIPDGNGGVRRAPMFFQQYKLKTGVESNTKGSWYGLTGIEFLGFTPDNLIKAAKEASEAFNATMAKAEASYAQAAPAKADATLDAVAASME